MKIKFAFALNNEGVFENNHFGEAHNYGIYTYNEGTLNLTEIIPNPFKSIGSRQKHGLKDKGFAIIPLLRKKEIIALVSKQFGKNIKIVNQYFIPIIINENDTLKVEKALVNNIDWIKDELRNKKSNFMLFRINTGIMKLEVK